jgi:hypothetical protein
VSEEVLTYIPSWLDTHGPIFNPLMVTVNAEEPTTAPEVVMVNMVAVVGLHVADKSGTLVAAGDIMGVTDKAKKCEG